MTYPPSTTRACPCTKDACVEHRNKIESAISAGFPILFIGAISTAGLNLSRDSSDCTVIGVSTRPGQTQFTLIPSLE